MQREIFSERLSKALQQCSALFDNLVIEAYLLNDNLNRSKLATILDGY